MLKRMIVASGLALSLTMAAFGDRDIKYDLFDDWKKLGYVIAVEDTSAMSMAFNVQVDAREVYLNALRVLPRMGFFIQNKNELEGAYGITTDWKTMPVSGISAFFSGYNAVRVRFVLGAYSGSGSTSVIQAKADLEVSGGDTWRAESSTELRNQVRQAVATILVRPIYGDYDQVNNYLSEYVKGDEPAVSREQFWEKYGLSGFKSLEEQPKAVVQPEEKRLKGAIKFRELAAIQASKPIVVTVAEDEEKQKAVQVDLNGTRVTMFPNDFMIFYENIKEAESLKSTLNPGESALGKPIEVGKGSIQSGAKVTSGKPPERLLLLSYDDGVELRFEVAGAQSKQLLEAMKSAQEFLFSPVGHPLQQP